jgi:hypothetical protein
MVIRKPLNLARAFVKDMRAYFEEENPIKRDGVTVRQPSWSARLKSRCG